MRIRQVRPEFFTDPVTAHLPAAVQVAYIALWCVADDAGWINWDTDQVGALVYPYKSIRVRTRLIESAVDVLADTGSLVFFSCGCVLLPNLEKNQRIGGNKSFTARDKHLVHTRTDRVSRLRARSDTVFQEVHTGMDGKVGNVKVGNGTREAGPSSDGLAASEFESKVPRLVALGGKA